MINKAFAKTAKIHANLPTSRLVMPNGDVVWRNDKGQRDRFDGPAIERVSGYKVWYRNDIIHRVGGPAIENPDGNNRYVVLGRELPYSIRVLFDKLIQNENLTGVDDQDFMIIRRTLDKARWVDEQLLLYGILNH